jgi:alpha-2-macroglobulin
MKAVKLFFLFLIVLFAASCGPRANEGPKQTTPEPKEAVQSYIPLDKGFSEYIAGYTSGIIPVNATIEIRFTSEFASKTDKRKLSGLFEFEPGIKGKAEWTDDITLVFRPSRALEPGKIYSGGLNLFKLGDPKERLRVFPLRLQTLKKDFVVSAQGLQCSSVEGVSYDLHGELVASDFIEASEVEDYVSAKLNKTNIKLKWDHSSSDNIHKFTAANIERTDKLQVLTLKWDGSSGGVKQKGSTAINIPQRNEFSVQNISVIPGESQRIDIVLSDPVDLKQETDGLIWFKPLTENTIQINSNTISIFPVKRLQGTVELNIESSLKNSKGTALSSSFNKAIDFTAVHPGIILSGNGVILPVSDNLIFPFKAANLKAVDLKIIKIFENNLPYFLQDNDINGTGLIKRFGRPVFSGRIDLMSSTVINSNTWNLFSVDLSDYIDVEPGVLYKVQLGMRRSYSLYPCNDSSPATDKYEEALLQSQRQQTEYWEDPENYYDDFESSIFYRYGYNWQEREDPCKNAYYSPDRSVTRNVLASNLGLIAKMGEDNNLHVIISDLRTAEPLNEVTVEAYDLQMQLIGTGTTVKDGSVTIFCTRKPFLVIAKKDKDRNYLKTNDGSSLSLSSFDVSGIKPENGIKAFIYGERDVWRPGDSIYLSIFIKDLKNDLPPGHPVQFELINPLDQRVDNQVQNLSGSNLLVFTTKTSDDAVTGNYTAQFKIGGATFTKRVRIETIKPNRLKIDLRFPVDILGGETKNLTGSLNAKWLNGAIAKNLKSTIDLIFKKTKTTFEKYGQYDFDDPASQFSSETIRIFDGTIDENGSAKVDIQPAGDMNAPGMLNAVFTTRVFEQGGDASISQKSWKYAPYPVFVGINLPGLKGKSRMLFTDADNEVKIVTVDENGKPVRSEVEITVYKISYRWWWESDDENLASFISNERFKPVLTKTLTTSGGEGSFKININKNDWGRYFIKATASSGHSTGKILLIDWPWDYGMKGNTTGATLLTVNTDKEKYNVGDNIRLSFPAPENARAIITLENATGILDELRINTSGPNTEVNFKAKPEMAPNVYAYVTVIQPHVQTVNDMPIRLYGIVPVMVENTATRISPQIKMADELRSQLPFEIKISEENGKPMTYTLAVVDEGLLDITGFKTPDPWSYFYAREALGVKTWDIYDYVLGAFGGTLERIFAVGGDETVADKSANKAKRFLPVVKFLGSFNLGSGKTNTHKIILPQYTGSVKTMVIAGNDRGYGFAEKSVLVRDPLMVLATAPRVLSPGEKVILPVTLFVQKDGIKEVKVEVESNDLISFGEKARTVAITGMEEKDIEFAFTVGNKMGKATIKVTCTGGGETALYKMEIEVRVPNPSETRSEMKVLSPDEKWEKQFRPFGAEGTSSASVEVSAMPSLNLEKRLDYLMEYPHGCSEQIISAAFPQLWLKGLTGDNPAVDSTASANITTAIHKIVSRQMSNGGIALWPGASQPDNWVTSYAGHFIIEAEKMGFSIPSGFKQKWISFQKKTSQDWRFDINFKQSSNDQAYRLFSLALAGQPEKGAMNRLRESKDIPSLSKWLLAAAFATTGRAEVAGELLDVRYIETEQNYWDYYYGSYLRDKAIILYTLTILKNEEKAMIIAKDICDNLNKDNWYSTQTIAWSLFSYMKFADMLPGNKSSSPKVTISLNGEKTGISIPAKQVTKRNLKITSTENTLIVENISQSPVYATLIQKGIPLKTDVTREDKGLSMKIDYLSLQLKPIDQKNIEQGSDFLMVVKVTNNTFRQVDNIALTEMVSSGWEIQNTRMYESDYGLKENGFDYRDYRDDRVYTYFGLDRGQTKTFVLVLNAAYKGEYYQPAVWCEAMYTENCYSRSPGVAVIVSGQRN